MATPVWLRLPPQLIESARAAQLANRQRLLAREARERLQALASKRAQKARSAAGLPAWPGAVPDPLEDSKRGRLWTRKRRLVRGVITHGLYHIYGQDINNYTYNNIIRTYALSGEVYSEFSETYQRLNSYLRGLLPSDQGGSIMSDIDAKITTFPVSQSSYLLISAIAKTTTAVQNTGVTTIVGGIGPGAAAIIDANPYRNFFVYDRTEQGWAIFYVFLLGQDSFSLTYKAWLVHRDGTKVVTVPQQFIDQATIATMQFNDNYYYTGPVVTGSGSVSQQQPDLPSQSLLRIHGNRLTFTKAPRNFAAASFGGVEVPPIINTQPGAEVIPGEWQAFSYATNAALFNDYEEPVIPSALANAIANPPGNVFPITYRFTVDPPNGQALARAPIAYLQDLGFSAADLTP